MWSVSIGCIALAVQASDLAALVVAVHAWGPRCTGYRLWAWVTVADSYITALILYNRFFYNSFFVQGKEP